MQHTELLRDAGSSIKLEKWMKFKWKNEFSVRKREKESRNVI